MQVLTLDDIRVKAPSVFAKMPSPKVSDRYTFVSTADILDDLMGRGWSITEAVQRRVNKNGRDASFTRHMLRLRHNDTKPFPGQVFPEVVITNSHDRQCRFQILAGLFRMICSNGLIIGYDGLHAGGKMTHIGDSAKFQQLIGHALETAQDSVGLVTAMQRKRLDDKGRLKFARAAMKLAFEDTDRFDPKLLLEARREEDGEKDVWTVFNVVQENLIQGGLKYQAGERGATTRSITHIGRNLDINTGLWDLAVSVVKGSKTTH